MSGVLPWRVVFLIVWGNLVLATVPHLLSGPLPAVPIAHLCWILSTVVVALAMRPPAGGAAMERRAIAGGLLAGLVIGLVTGALDAWSGLIGGVIVALVALGQQGSVALVMITTIALGFHVRLIGAGTRPPDPPPWTHGPAGDRPYNPNAIFNPSDTAQRARAIAYGRSLWPGDAPGPSDERRLFGGAGNPAGPLARVWAEPFSYLDDPLDLLPGELGRGQVGRIVARIWVDPRESAGYPPLDLPPGVSWLWVDSLRTAPGLLRGVIIPENGTPVRIRILTWGRSLPPGLGTQPGWINHAAAQWVYRPEGESLVVSCGLHAQCRLEPAHPR